MTTSNEFLEISVQYCLRAKGKYTHISVVKMQFKLSRPIDMVWEFIPPLFLIIKMYFFSFFSRLSLSQSSNIGQFLVTFIILPML